MTLANWQDSCSESSRGEASAGGGDHGEWSRSSRVVDGLSAQIAASGGVAPEYEHMQGRAMPLRRDLHAARSAADPSIRDPRLWDSDRRHLASHCDPNDTALVCMRDADDGEGGYPYRCLPGVPLDGACDGDPGTFGEGADSCAPGLDCVNGRCIVPKPTGSVCDPDDGEGAGSRSARCDWRLRMAKLEAIPCPRPLAIDEVLQTPTDGAKIETVHCTEDGEWLLDSVTGDIARYVAEYDDGCRSSDAGAGTCGLIPDEIPGVAYCDGRD